MSVDIHHRPFLDTEKVVKHYSEKDGVPIKYVCTSALDTGIKEVDIFYRDTPHPEFGNKYFGLHTSYEDPKLMYITNADRVEDLQFDMVWVNNQWHYSKHRWDFFTIGDVSIDGGRAYLKMVGNLSHPVKTFRVKNGEFIEDSNL